MAKKTTKKTSEAPDTQPTSKAGCVKQFVLDGSSKGLTQKEIADATNQKYGRTDITPADVANAISALKVKGKKGTKTIKTAANKNVTVKRKGSQMEFPPKDSEFSLDELVGKFGTISAAKTALESALAKLQ